MQSFLIGGDGRVYEGAGWHTVGAHTYGYNRNGLGLAFIGDFTGNHGVEHQCTMFAQNYMCYIYSAQRNFRPEQRWTPPSN